MSKLPEGYTLDTPHWRDADPVEAGSWSVEATGPGGEKFFGYGATEEIAKKIATVQCLRHAEYLTLPPAARLRLWRDKAAKEGKYYDADMKEILDLLIELTLEHEMIVDRQAEEAMPTRGRGVDTMVQTLDAQDRGEF